ncbi:MULTISPECIES: hypothetical protein [unclassified Exiguobacterium]|uniref:hypothetical protein n=1 Tax=unclassified Exiguobacterium TaxID=2644629 RepID=UPI0008B38D33|nr:MULTISPECIES: hypothetical protein [unclassified Exiguobacterium]OGX78794.1 hypothetical protein A6395_10205 [Exiguobacterium sp. SH31]TCI51871.1 hypothetical protein EVJ24_12100 [Exiguobacterium sp. SH1S21]TCI69003.1 hypothetical protein EVJ22_11050 [Exiguobacterium sp. SH0S7]
MNVYIACPCGFVTSAMAAKLFAQASSGRMTCHVTHGTYEDVPAAVDLIIYQQGTEVMTHPTAYVRSVNHMLSLEEYRQVVEEWVNEYEA